MFAAKGLAEGMRLSAKEDQGKLIHNEDKRDSFSCDIADYEALWEHLLTILS